MFRQMHVAGTAFYEGSSLFSVGSPLFVSHPMSVVLAARLPIELHVANDNPASVCLAMDFAPDTVRPGDDESGQP